MRRRSQWVAVSTACVLLVPLPATAGGWWSNIELDKDPIAIGESVTATAQISSPLPPEAERAGGYHAYLVQGIDRDALDEAMTTPQAQGWWTPPPTMIRLGEVELMGQAQARARFTVPEVEPGLYGLMLCSADCVEPLADVIPRLDLAVHGDALLAHSLRTLAEDPMREWHLTMIEDRIGSVGDQVRDLHTELSALKDATAAPTSSPAPSPTPTVTSETAPVAASAATPQSVSQQLWIAVAAAFLAGAALAAMVVSRRQRHRGPHVPAAPRILEAEPASVAEPVGAAPE